MQGDGGLCSIRSSTNPVLFAFHEIINGRARVPYAVTEDQGLVLLSLPGSAAPPPRSNVYRSRAMTPRGPVRRPGPLSAHCAQRDPPAHPSLSVPPSGAWTPPLCASPSGSIGPRTLLPRSFCPQSSAAVVQGALLGRWSLQRVLVLRDRPAAGRLLLLSCSWKTGHFLPLSSYGSASIWKISI